jgi:hypothetical protein
MNLRWKHPNESLNLLNVKQRSLAVEKVRQKIRLPGIAKVPESGFSFRHFN